MSLLMVLQQADYARQKIEILHPPSVMLPGIPLCPEACITVMYALPPADDMDAGGSTTYTNIMTKFAELNARRTGTDPLPLESPVSDPTFSPTRSMGIVPVSDERFLYNYVLQNPNRTMWGVSFDKKDTQLLNVQYNIWYNSTQTRNDFDIFANGPLSFMRGLDEAIISVLEGTVNANLSVQVREWPTLNPSVLSDEVAQKLGPVMVFCSLTINFLGVINHVMREKELKVRHVMELAGLKPSLYWIGILVSNTIILVMQICSIMITGYAMRISLFVRSNWVLLFIGLLLFGEAFTAFGLFLTTLCHSKRTAIMCGMLTVIVGLLFHTISFSSLSLGYIWWRPLVNSAIPAALSMLPFFNLLKFLLDVMTLTIGKSDVLTSTYTPGPGFGWTSLVSSIDSEMLPTYEDGSKPNAPTPIWSLILLLVNAATWCILTWYFDNIIPNDYGYCRPPWFIFRPAYWGFTELEPLLRQNGPLEIQPDEDADVAEEKNRALDQTNWSVLKIVHMSKIFKSGFLAGRKQNHAVSDLCLSLGGGQLLALLGHNGAGKSTTMNILCGLTLPSSGDALMCGLSIKTRMNDIRSIIGVCPQHDILLPELTGREHLLLFAGLRGLNANVMETVNRKLDSLGLLNKADGLVETYSGGMKRRLSLAIATIGDPSLVFLDEPTTGLDPVNKKQVWAYIEKFKQGRVMIMTTHSMDEAEALGDKVAVMSQGRLRAIGTPHSLRVKYGTGLLKIVVEVFPDRERNVHDKVMELVPEASWQFERTGKDYVQLLYSVPLVLRNRIPGLATFLASEAGRSVHGWNISKTTLEVLYRLSTICNHLPLIFHRQPGRIPFSHSLSFRCRETYAINYLLATPQLKRGKS
ncbi:hypothetical protein DFJ73DRAFT_631314 [Zopfochytrium polystomum]|nr:hypothetical protein DFJ73DRAFT_631314 [Zopfochytrium polystomum]